MLDWTQGVAAVTSFKVPVTFLFDYKTTTQNPDLGWFLIAIGVTALVVSLFVRAGIWRVLLGILALVAASLFVIQIARGLSDSNTNLSFTRCRRPGPVGDRHLRLRADAQPALLPNGRKGHRVNARTNPVVR